MTVSAEKLGLFLPEDLHQKMVQAAERLNRKSPRGSVRCIYERAFAQLVGALDAGEEVAFPAVRGAKVRVSVRLSGRLCARVRAHLQAHNLKLTDLAFTAIDRFLHAEEGARSGASIHQTGQSHARHHPDRNRREDDRPAAAAERQARR